MTTSSTDHVYIEIAAIDPSTAHVLPLAPDQVCHLYAQSLALRGSAGISPLFISQTDGITLEEAAGVALARYSACHGNGTTWYATTIEGFEHFLQNLFVKPEDQYLIPMHLDGLKVLGQQGLIETKEAATKDGRSFTFLYPNTLLLLMFLRQVTILARYEQKERDEEEDENNDAWFFSDDYSPHELGSHHQSEHPPAERLHNNRRSTRRGD